MKLTKQQKILAAVVCLGASAIALDRLVLSNGVSGPDSASATSGLTPDNPNQPNLGSTASAFQSDANKADQAAKADKPSEPANHAALSRKLQQLATEKNLDTNNLPDAFDLDNGWTKKPASESTAPSKPSDTARNGHSSSGRSYRLEAVMVDDQGQSVAIVGGQTLHVGDQLGTYTLIRIAPRSATFRNPSMSHKRHRLIKLQLSGQ